MLTTATAERCVPQANRSRGSAYASGKTALIRWCVEPNRLCAQQRGDAAERCAVPVQGLERIGALHHRVLLRDVHLALRLRLLHAAPAERSLRALQAHLLEHVVFVERLGVARLIEPSDDRRLRQLLLTGHDALGHARAVTTKRITGLDRLAEQIVALDRVLI